MISLEGKLAKVVEKMKPATRRKFAEKSKAIRGNVEATLNIAESVLAEDGESVRESIRRNNGAQKDFVQESGSEAESERVLMEGLAKARPQSFAKVVEAREAESRLTPRQLADKDFCMLVGLSEKDATRVALSGDIRD